MNAVDTQVEDYASRVRAALADLPAGARDELLADLPDHLAEVAGEDDGTDLTTRLGEPEAYAAELRSAAGLAPAPSGSLRDRARDWRDRPWARETAAFLPELRPGWWVLRGLLVAVVVTVWFGAGGVAAWIVLGVAAAVGSVAVGRRALAERRWRPADVALTVAAAAAAAFCLYLVTGGSPATAPDPGYGTGYDAGYDQGPGLGGATNLYVYGPDGKPLQDVQIFDQDGRPVTLPNDTDPDGNLISTVPRYDPSGRVVPNVYPQEQTVTGPVVDDDGNPTVRRVTPPPVAPATLVPR